MCLFAPIVSLSFSLSVQESPTPELQHNNYFYIITIIINNNTYYYLITIWTVAASLIINCIFCYCFQSWYLMVHKCSWSLSLLSSHLLPLSTIPLSLLSPLFHSSLLPSPFFPAQPNRSGQMAAHSESGSRGLFQLMREFFSAQLPKCCSLWELL